MKKLTPTQKQKKIEDLLVKLGFDATNEFEEQGINGQIMFTKWETLGIGVRIELDL